MPSVEWGEAVGAALVVREGHDRPDESELKELEAAVANNLAAQALYRKLGYVATNINMFKSLAAPGA